MKKIIALLVVLMFLVTLTGTVIADSDSNDIDDDSNDLDIDEADEPGEGDDDFDINQMKDIGDAFRKAARERADQLKEQIKQRTEEAKERMKEQIEQSKEQFEQARERIKEAQERYLDAKEQFHERMKKYEDLKKEYQDANSDVKQELKSQFKEHTRLALVKQADALINKLDHLIEKGIAPEETAELIAELEVIKTTLQDTNASKEDVVEALRDIRDRITPLIRDGAQLKAAKVLDNKLSAILNKANITEERVLAMVEKLQGQGYDTNSIDEELAEFSQKMSDANTQITQAKLLWMQAETAQEKHDLLKEGFDIAKEANKSIVEGFHSLREALKEIRALSNQNGDDDDSNTPEVDDDSNNQADLNTPLSV